MLLHLDYFLDDWFYILQFSSLNTSFLAGNLTAEVTIKLNHCCVSGAASFCTLQNEQTQKFQIRYSGRGVLSVDFVAFCHLRLV